MPARDLIHDAVRTALEKDGWTITDDPLSLKYEDKRIFIDLGAERWVLAAERDSEKIAVEIKSFLHTSVLKDLEDAFGQYMIYLTFLNRVDPLRKLFLAVPDVVYVLFTESPAIQMLLQDNGIPLIVVNPETQEIVEWMQS